MRRIMGTEIEYGISSPGDPSANPVLTSTQAVLAYAAAADVPRARRPRWDYEVESPLRDARGFDLSRPGAPTPVIDVDEVGAANMILTNGARLYVDHAHPEFAAPEVTDPMDAVIWDKAGERVMEEAARFAGSVPGAPKLQLYKNNVDGKGASYGSHENYLMARSTPFAQVVTGLTPFFASRQVFTGSGRVGIGQSGETPGFQLSQRADYMEVEVGLETTLKRGIINTRDEPHADADKYRRLHVIIGDANLAETATYLKVGTTCLVLDCIESGVDLSDLALARPVAAVHAISHDPTLRTTVELADGRTLTALALQREYHARAAALLERGGAEPAAGATDDRDAEAAHLARSRHVLATWGEVLDLLERDPMECADLLDWPAKLRLLQGFKDREGLGWAASRLHLVDLQYSDVRLDKGLYNRLVARGSMRRLVTEEQVTAAVSTPPTDTRAYFRGECLRRFGTEVAAASWDSIIFDVGRDSLVRIPTLEPLRGSRAHVGALLDSVDSAVELVDALTS
ncbi:pup deamidase/depupylase [Rhodococcus aerolatus]